MPRCALLIACLCTPLAAVEVAGIVSDHAVLQQGVAVPLWGTGTPGEAVTVAFRDQRVATTVDASGRWLARLAPLTADAADAPGAELTISGANRIVLRDIVVGEVWLGSGQSNLVWPLPRTTDGEAVLAAADLPWLRLSSDTLWPSYRTPGGGWLRCTPESARGFSALLIHFARRLHAARPVPIGLIARAVSGSAAGPWIDEAGFAADPAVQAAWRRYAAETWPGLRATHEAELARWQPLADAAEAKAAARLATLGTATYELRATLTGALAGPLPGDLVVQLAADPAITAARAWRADDKERAFPVTIALKRDGDAVTAALTVEMPAGVLATAATPASYQLTLQRSGWSLAGAWTGRIGTVDAQGAAQGEVQRARDEKPPARPRAPPAPDQPGVGEHWQRFIAPVAPYAIHGVVWDQGESGSGLPDVPLDLLMPALVASWRRAWSGPELPWLFVQKPSGGGWRWTPEATDAKGAAVPRPLPPAITDALLRGGFARERYQRPQAITGAAMAVALDLDGGIHPGGKLAYGERLADIALDRCYGVARAWRAPQLAGHVRDGATLRLRFDHVGVGLVARGGEPLAGFLIAGDDRVFRWAQARIEGAEVVVSHPDLAAPVAARYAWAEAPVWANLFTADGLPALTGRTDDWPEPVEAKRP